MNVYESILFSGFQARLRRQGRAEGTVRAYSHHVRQFLEWLEDRDPVEASRADVERHLDEWSAAGGVSTSTVRLRIAALDRFYDFLDSRGLLVDETGRELRSPIDRIERPRSRSKAIDYLSADEDTAIRDAYLAPQERSLVSLLRWTGMRIGEATAILWSDVDFVRGEIRVRESKTDSGIRTIPILPELRTELETWRSCLEGRALYRPNGPVLAVRRKPGRGAWNGEPGALSPQFAGRLFSRVAERAHLDRKITAHLFRRTFATDLLNRGARLETVSKLLGHADTRTTQGAYAQLLDETARDEFFEALGA